MATTVGIHRKGTRRENGGATSASDTAPRRSSRVTLKDIADKANVSIAAVSLALADRPGIGAETKSRVIRLSREMGYVPRRDPTIDRASERLMKQRLGFLLLGGKLEHENYLGMLHALMVNSAASNLRVDMSAIEDASDVAKVNTRVLADAKEVDGLILMGEVGRATLLELRGASVPHVVLGYPMAQPGDLRGTNTQVVASDEIGMGRVATAALIAAGHKRVAFVTEVLQPGLYFERWLTGYTMALLSARIPLDSSLVHVTGTAFTGGAPVAEAMSALKQPPTAYVIPDTRTAASFVQAMRERKRELSRSSVVIGGQDFISRRYGMEDYPQVLEDLSTMASVSLQHLRRLVRQPASHAAEILVDFTTRNLPEPP